MTLGEIMAKNLNGETFDQYRFRLLFELNSRDLTEGEKYNKLMRAREKEQLFGYKEVNESKTSEESYDQLKRPIVVDAEPQFENETIQMTSIIEENLNDSPTSIQLEQQNFENKNEIDIHDDIFE